MDQRRPGSAGAPSPGAQTRTPTLRALACPLPALRRAGKAKSTGHGGDGRRSAAARQERVRALADTRDVLRVGEGQPGPAVRLTPSPRATPGPRAGCNPGVARRASGPRTRRPVTVRRLTRTRARPLTKVYFVSSKGAKGSATRRRPGAGGSVSGRVARAPPGGRGVRARRRVHANGVPPRPGPPAPAWRGLQGSLRGKRLVWLLNCFPARRARKATIPSANKRVQINKNAESFESAVGSVNE